MERNMGIMQALHKLNIHMSDNNQRLLTGKISAVSRGGVQAAEMS